MSESRDQQRLWIASYPRSGNTFFRNVLHRVYGIPSESFFNEPNREVSENWFDYRAIKTHMLPSELPAGMRIEDGHVAVYLIRDGRDALVSGAHHRKDWAAPFSDFEVNLYEAAVAPGESFFGGGWSQHVEKWSEVAHVVVRFEDLIVDPIGQIERLRPFFDLPEPDHDALPTFETLRSGNAEYGNTKSDSDYNLSEQEIAERNFRRGKVGSWRDEMPSDVHDLFWLLHGDTLEKWGYGACERPAIAEPRDSATRVLMQVGNIEDPPRDGTWRYTIELINGIHELEQKLAGRVEVDLALKSDQILSFSAYEKHRENLYQCIERHRSEGLPALRRLPTARRATLDLNAREKRCRKWLVHRPLWVFRRVPGALGRMLVGAWKGPVLGRIGWKLEKWWNAKRLPIDRASAYWDVVHMMLPQWAPATAEIRARWLITFHDMTDRLFPEYHEEGNILMAASGMRLADLRQSEFMAISNNTKHDLVEKEGIREDRIHLALEGANWDLFQPVHDPDRWREVAKKLDLNPERPFFLVLNTLEPRKNLEGTLAAFFRFIDKTGADVDLVISGKMGWKMDQLTADDRLTNPRLRFVGFVDDHDLPALYSRALALCYLSFYEGFGLPPLEAMCCKTPVIASNVSSMPEVVGDGGLLVDPSDTEAIADAMAAINRDRHLRDSLADKAFVQAHRFNWMKMAWLTMRVYLSS